MNIPEKVYKKVNAEIKKSYPLLGEEHLKLWAIKLVIETYLELRKKKCV